MIYESLEILREQVENYLADIGLGDNLLILDNIAHFVDNPSKPNEDLDNKIVLSLLNMEEETALKNIKNSHSENGNTIKKNNPVNLNLYLLFICNRSDYAYSLRSLGGIIEYFQAKKIFNQTNTIFSKSNEALQAVTDFRFTVELYTPTFEELNYIWGTLGGKSYPSALYKLTLVSLERDHILDSRTSISALGGTLNHMN